MAKRKLSAPSQTVKKIPFTFVDLPAGAIDGVSFIYGLIDPITGLLRYIGRTRELADRIRGHARNAAHGCGRYTNYWIRSLWRRGSSPRVIILETCRGNGAVEEIFHIALARRDGLPLTNHTDGGGGALRLTPVNSKRASMIGKRFGRVTVIRDANRSAKYVWRFECQCDCGKITIIRGDHLRRGNIRSCGCMQLEIISKRSTRHGCTRSREYHSWAHMRARCMNPAHRQFAKNGGNGISICRRWSKFENCLADMGPCPRGFFLRRINPRKSHSPANCEWASRATMSANNRRTVKFTLDGRTRCLSAWARDIGLDPGKLAKRINSGRSLREALTTPSGRLSRPAKQGERVPGSVTEALALRST